MRTSLLFAFTLLGCATAGENTPVDSTCAQEITGTGTAYSMQLQQKLVGKFHVIQVDTTWPGHANVYERSVLTLNIADDAAQAKARSEALFNHLRTIQLVGESKSTNAKLAEYADLDSTRITIGCQHCVDAALTSLHVASFTPTAFYGTWYADLGNYVIVRDGQRAPEPAGYFCALRIR